MRSVSLISRLIFALVISVSSIQASTHRHDTLPPPHDNIAVGGKSKHGSDAASHAPKAHWSSPATEKTRANPIALTHRVLIEASELYRDNCAACHGGDGRGIGPHAQDLTTPPANLFAMAPSHADGDLRWKIAKGRGEMPGWAEVLSDEQIWKLVHYMKSLAAYHLVQNSKVQ